MSTLPESLSPFATHHPASSAYRITMSCHEWTWTQSEQEEIARAVVALDLERQQLRRKIASLEKSIEEYARQCAECMIKEANERAVG